MTNAANIKFNAYRLQQAHMVAATSECDMEVSGAKFEIERRTAWLEAAGFAVFADEHDVMLVQ